MKLPTERLHYLERQREPERRAGSSSLIQENHRMQPIIRPFQPTDYAAIAAVRNATMPEYPITAGELRFNDQHRDAKQHFARFVAEVDGQVVGMAAYGQFTDMYHPHTFWADVQVHPEYQRQGIGSALYSTLMRDLEQWRPLSIRPQFRDDQAAARRFATRYGYHEDRRSWESRIVPAEFDPAPFAAQRARVAAAGIEITTVSQLSADPDYRRKLYDLFVEVDEDEPRPGAYTPWTYDFFAAHTFDDPNYLPDAYFVALSGAEYVGMSNLWLSQGSADLYTGLTGVKRAYRRRGIALALKLHALDYARSVGAPVVKTWNDSINRPMLSINERLGFVKQPAWVDVLKVLREE